MNKIAVSVLFLSVYLFSTAISSAQTRVLVHLSDVRTVYLDETSFKITSSSCGTHAGGMYLPCPRHSTQRVDFLVALKRWLGKSGFRLVDNKDDAEAILQGTLSIDDHIGRDGTYGPDPGINEKNKRRHPDSLPDLDEVPSGDRQALFEPHWEVQAWLTNQKGRRIWMSGSWHPGISYWGPKPKSEGKKLAKAIEYDFKHHI